MKRKIMTFDDAVSSTQEMIKEQVISGDDRGALASAVLALAIAIHGQNTKPSVKDGSH